MSSGDTDTQKKRKGFRLFGSKKSKKTQPSKSAPATKTTAGSNKASSSSAAKDKPDSSSKHGRTPSDSSTLMTKDQPMPKYYENNPDKPMLGLAEPASEASSKTKSTTATAPQETPPKTVEEKEEVPERKDLGEPKSKVSWLCRTSYFRSMCDSAFKLIDVDGSGEVDEKELYTGLLLIHLKLGTMAGPAACKPLSRERCHTVFQKFDKDNSGQLDRTEFDNVMMLLFGNVLFRVVLQYALTLAIVPLIAQWFLSGVYFLVDFTWNLITELDEHYIIAHEAESFIENTRDAAIGLYKDHAPNFVHSGVNKMSELLDSVPDTVWNTIPLTLTSAVLGIAIVPYCILKIDDFFQYMADKRAKTVDEEIETEPSK